MVTNRQLQHLYHEFNRKWHGNRLPKDMVVYFDNMRDQQGSTSFLLGRPLFIKINKSLRVDWALTAMTLHHEMVHVKLQYRGGHGPVFQREMKRLARLGAFRRWW